MTTRSRVDESAPAAAARLPLGAWWLVAALHVWPELFVPAPQAVWARRGDSVTVHDGRVGLSGHYLWEHVWASLWRLLRGVGLAIVAGVAARPADVFLTWGEPPDLVAEKIDRARAAAAREGGRLAFGIRLHVIARDTAGEAWAETERMLAGLDPRVVADRQAEMRASQSEGQRRMTALHDGDPSRLLVAPNLWAGIGLVRAGAGTALSGSFDEVAERMAEYHETGIDEFILSGYPHLEEV